MEKKVADYIAEYRMINKQDIVIAGISGGADSICLLLMLLELQKTIPFDIVAVHVNHCLRGEDALRDEKYVQKLCEKYHVKLEVYRENVELFAKKRKQSLEEAGRNVRREAFQNAVSKYGGTKIALAHHKNDNAETVIMNLARGSGISGLAGIRPVSGMTIRPLLCLMREEIEQYLEIRGIDFCTDETNASDEYTRNRIRNHVLPFLTKEVNEQSVPHIADMAEQVLKIWDYMRDEVEKYYAEIVEEREDGLFVKKEGYEKIPEVFRSFILKKVLEKEACREQDLHRIHVESMERLLEKQTGKRVDLPYGLIAERCYGGILVFKKKVAENRKEILEFEVNWDGEATIQTEEFIFSFETRETNEMQEEKVYTKYFDYDIINRTIALRTRRPGDYITIDEEGKTQKLKSYFINEKIPREERDQIWLLAEGNHVLWVIGHRRGHALYVTSKSKKIIKITINKGEDKNVRKN